MHYERIMQASVNALAQGKRKAHCSNGGASAAQTELDYVEYAARYGEPGYDQPEHGVVFANWNHFPRKTCELLERAGYAVEWSDEWIISHETGKAYRTSPNSYSWTRYCVITDDGDVIGGDEIESGDQADWYINEYLLNDPERANVFKLDLTAFGFRQYNGEYESGWHPGQTDDPREATRAIRAAHPHVDIVFSIASVGQFDTHWTAWIRDVVEED